MVSVSEVGGGSRSAAEKVRDLEALPSTLDRLRRGGATIVQCHGTFDLMHPGHIRHLAEARQQGSVLVVTLTADRFINKGPGRPIFNEVLRAETLASLEMVDYVALVPHPTAVEAIAIIKPDVYVKGSEYTRPEDDPTGKIRDETCAVLAAGGRMYFTDDITFSSSKLINENFSPFPPETENWLRTFRAATSAEEVVGWLDRLADLKVAVIGEAIIDEYVFCLGLGKAAKDPILAFNYKSTETYAGGSLAVANHAAGFCGSVHVLTLLGETNRREDFIRRALKPQVDLYPVTQHGAPTLHKRRFVDSHTGNKLFELYTMEDGPLAPATEDSLIARLEEVIGDADVVIVPDYGHGMMTPRVVETLTRTAPYLVVNTQANAGNRGFNYVSKYPRADYVCIAGHEAELETRMRNASDRDLALAMAERIDCPKFTITVGSRGTLHYDKGGDFYGAPALATKVVDRVGSGDAVLALTGMLLSVGAPWPVIGLLANLAGAEMVGDLGNRTSIEKGRLAKNVVSLLK